MKNWKNKIVWSDGEINTYNYYNLTDEEVRGKLNKDCHEFNNIVESYYYNEDWQLKFYWTKKKVYK